MKRLRSRRAAELKSALNVDDAPGGMNHAARVLACRSAPMATAYCDQLRDTFTAMGGCIRSGEIALALDGFEVIAQPMQKLLVFALVAADLLRDAQHPLRREVETFCGALLEALDHMEASLLARDFGGLAAALEGEVIETLDGYRAIGRRLSVALRPRLAA